MVNIEHPGDKACDNHLESAGTADEDTDFAIDQIPYIPVLPEHIVPADQIGEALYPSVKADGEKPQLPAQDDEVLFGSGADTTGMGRDEDEVPTSTIQVTTEPGARSEAILAAEGKNPDDGPGYRADSTETDDIREPIKDTSEGIGAEQDATVRNQELEDALDKIRLIGTEADQSAYTNTAALDARCHDAAALLELLFQNTDNLPASPVQADQSAVLDAIGSAKIDTKIYNNPKYRIGTWIRPGEVIIVATSEDPGAGKPLTNFQLLTFSIPVAAENPTFRLFSAFAWDKDREQLHGERHGRVFDAARDNTTETVQRCSSLFHRGLNNLFEGIRHHGVIALGPAHEEKQA